MDSANTSRDASLGQWLGASRARTEDGAPQVVYHGTGADIEAFAEGRMVWVSATPELASDYAQMRADVDGRPGNVVPLHVRIERPFVVSKALDHCEISALLLAAIEQTRAEGRQVDRPTTREHTERIQAHWNRIGYDDSCIAIHEHWSGSGAEGLRLLREFFHELGFDGIQMTEQGAVTYGVFDRAAVKSAISAESYSVDSRIRFSRQAAPFKEQVRQRLQSGERRGELLDMGRTPAVLRMLGAPDLPMKLPPAVLEKMVSGKSGERPPLDEQLIERLPELLDEPTAVFASASTSDAFVVALDARDAAGSPVVAAVAISRAAGGSPMYRVNLVTSAYGKDDTTWFDRQFAAGRALFVDNEKALGRLVSGSALNCTTEPDGQGPGRGADASARTLLGPADLRNYRAAQRSAFSRASSVQHEWTPGDEESPASSGPRRVQFQARVLKADGASPNTGLTSGKPSQHGTAHASAASWLRDLVDATPMGRAVRIVRTAHELPAQARSNPLFDSTRVDGTVVDGRIYLVADNIPDRVAAFRVLAHEAVGHLGVERILGPRRFERVLRQIDAARRAGHHAELFAEVDVRYPGADDATRAREAIAVFAERQIRVGWLARVLASVRAFMRDRLGLPLAFGPRDLAALVTRAARNVEREASGGSAASESSAGTPKNMAFDRASRGARDRADSGAFQRWFAGSKVVDADGRPAVVYHGTDKTFEAFDPHRKERNCLARFSDGFYFTEQTHAASAYAGEQAGSCVLPVFVSLQSPLEVGSVAEYREIVFAARTECSAIEQCRRAALRDSELLVELGYDGLIHWTNGAMEAVVAFGPEQIKSATGNNGNFDPHDARVCFSRKAPAVDGEREVSWRADSTHDGAFNGESLSRHEAVAALSPHDPLKDDRAQLDKMRAFASAAIDPEDAGFAREVIDAIVERMAKKQAALDAFAAQGDGATLKVPGVDRWAAILPDLSGDGKYRIQTFDRRGFMGHTVHSDATAAVIEAGKEGYTEPDPDRLDALAATVEWRRGMELSAAVQEGNSRRLSWAQADAKVRAIQERHAAEDSAVGNNGGQARHSDTTRARMGMA